MPPKSGDKLETFSGRLAYLLNAKRISQVMLAEDLAATQSTVSRWLKGSMPDPKFAVALSKRLNVSLEWLLYGAAEKPSELQAFLTEMREHRIPKLDAAIREFSEGPDAQLQHVIEHVYGLREIRESLVSTTDYAEAIGSPIFGGFIDKPDYGLPPPDKSRMTWNDLHDKICEVWGLPLSTSMEELVAIAKAKKDEKSSAQKHAPAIPFSVGEKGPSGKISAAAEDGAVLDFVRNNLEKLRKLWNREPEALKSLDLLAEAGKSKTPLLPKLSSLQLKKLAHLLRAKLADPDQLDAYKFDGPVPPSISIALSKKSRERKV